MEQVFEYLEAKGIDVLRINSDTDDDDDMEVISVSYTHLSSLE